MSNYPFILRRFLSQTKEYYPLIIVYSICISVLTLAAPISVQSLVNTFSFGPYFQPIFIISMILMTLLFLLGLIKSLQYLLVEYLQRKIYAKITATIARSYLADRVRETQRDDSMVLANRYFDVVIVQKSLAYLVTDGIAVLLQTALGLLLISLYHPFFIVFGILIVGCLLFPLWLYSNRAMDSSVAESSAKHEVAEFIEGLANKNSEIDIEKKIKETDDIIYSFISARSSHFRTVFKQNVLYVIMYAVMNALLLGLGGFLVVSNQLTIGQLVAAEIVVNAILYHFLYAKKYLETFYDMFAAGEKVKIFFDQEIVDCSKVSSEYSIKTKSILTKKDERFYDHFKSVRFIFYPKNYKKIAKYFAVAIVMVFISFSLVPWQQTSKGEGVVTALNPNDRLQSITATVDGRIEEWLVKEGDIVRKGDPIVKILDNDPNYLERLELRRDAAIKKFDAAKEASDTARLNFHRQEKLVDEGLSSRKEFEKANIVYKKLLAEEATAAADLAKAEVSLSRQQLQVVAAPRDGKIQRVLLGSGTINVKEGQDLAQFVPEASDPVVELRIDGNDLPLVTPGRKVRLQFEGWPAVQFTGWPSVAVGSFGGIVKIVDPSVSKDGYFRAFVTPDKNDPMDWPDQNYLRQGARAIGIVLLEEVSIGYEAWRKINGFPKSLKIEPMEKGSGTKIGKSQ